jgi:hypothetical protein
MGRAAAPSHPGDTALIAYLTLFPSRQWREGNSLLRSSDRNPPQQGFLCLRQRQCEHPVLDLRTNLILIDLV